MTRLQFHWHLARLFASRGEGGVVKGRTRIRISQVLRLRRQLARDEPIMLETNNSFQTDFNNVSIAMDAMELQADEETLERRVEELKVRSSRRWTNVITANYVRNDKHVSWTLFLLTRRHYLDHLRLCQPISDTQHQLDLLKAQIDALPDSPQVRSRMYTQMLSDCLHPSIWKARFTTSFYCCSCTENYKTLMVCWMSESCLVLQVVSSTWYVFNGMD